MSKVLIVVDMQNDFVTGSLGNPMAEAVVPKIAEKILQPKTEDTHIVFTLDTHDHDYLETQEGKHLPIEHCIYGSNGWRLVPELRGWMHDDNFIKKYSFGYDDWENFFKYSDIDVTSIELVGVCTDICVVSNALILKALYPEIPIAVDASCCAGTTPENHKAALQVMKCCQIDVIGE